MLSNFINIRILPRWIIIIIDLGLSLFAASLAYLLRFNFAVELFDLTGTKILSVSDTPKIDVCEIEGIYFLVIYDKTYNKVSSRKIIINR